MTFVAYTPGIVAVVDPSWAAIIAAICSGIAAILGGVALIITALNHRKVEEVKKQVQTSNGRTLAKTVERIEADVAEQRREGQS